MPFVDIETSSGPFSFAYAIATPTSHSAKQIAPKLPCILFIHSIYIGQECFEFQFADRSLRQFNLISIDMRGHGETKGVMGGEVFTPTETAADINLIMEKLNLPPCHIFGLSNGCTVALNLAVSYPNRVLSLTLCSPVPPQEPEEIVTGLLEVFQYWLLRSKPAEGQADFDEEMEMEVMVGANQFLYNYKDKSSRHVQAILEYGLYKAQRCWAGSPEKIKNCEAVNVDWVLKRKPIPLEQLGKISVPVSIIHCYEDVPYPLQYSTDWKERLLGAGVKNVSLHEVPGAHYGNVTDPEEINRILYSTVTSCYPEPIEKETLPGSPTVSSRLMTPFTASLTQAVGYDPGDSD
ncbi:alpha/beta-hydrolase [Pholiota conissans]|uniref:Alpha/beta-hydrolase n=1 Tax=Pholiota conissans TaxID=109636 RepID=A0A9P6D0E8_9AGAR|nr:alpha/beta-hydrolase [Pholiota conissans]